MFPVDPRLGKDYMRGAEQSVQTIQTAAFAPMHFGFNYNEANAFKIVAEAHGTRFLSIYSYPQLVLRISPLFINSQCMANAACSV